MSRYYSPSTKGLYISDVHGIKGDAGSKVPTDAIEITQKEHEALITANSSGAEIYVQSGKVVTRTKVLTLTEKLVIVRAQRDKRLSESDWTQYPDAPMSADKQSEWAQYRQVLRDFPDTLGTNFDIDAIVWPAEPA